MKYKPGFTIIEILFIVIFLGIASVFFFIQKNDIEVASRDDTRRTAINAFYYGLEEVYFKEHKSYPRTLNSQTLPFVDADLFTDPFGVKLGEGDSDYRYEVSNCEGESCKSYTLRADLEAEDDFIKQSRNN